MLWLLAITVTPALFVLGKRLGVTDEVHSVALYVTALVSGLWGIVLAPVEAQLALELLVLAGTVTLSRQTNSLRP